MIDRNVLAFNNIISRSWQKFTMAFITYSAAVCLSLSICLPACLSVCLSFISVRVCNLKEGSHKSPHLIYNAGSFNDCDRWPFNSGSLSREHWHYCYYRHCYSYDAIIHVSMQLCCHKSAVYLRRQCSVYQLHSLLYSAPETHSRQEAQLLQR